MRHSQALSCCLVVLLSIVILVSSSASSPLDAACKYVPVENKDISYDYCMKFFQANNGSATADKAGLCDIARNISRAVAIDTVKRIDALIASEKDKTILARLSDCHVLYTAAVTQLQKPENLNSVISDTYTCENGFLNLGVPSPLAAENAVFLKDCIIALILTSNL